MSKYRCDEFWNPNWSLAWTTISYKANSNKTFDAVFFHEKKRAYSWGTPRFLQQTSSDIFPFTT